MKKVYLRTFGCQMNEHDSERIIGMLAGRGYEQTEDWESADLIVLNTCAIRQKAEEKVLSTLGRFKKHKLAHPKQLIAVGGCVAQAYGQQLIERAPHVDLVFGTGAINRLPQLVERAGLTKTVDVEFPEKLQDRFVSEQAPRTGNSVSRFVTIMEGCDNFCTYCIVPYVRGREVSRPAQEIINEIENLVQSGVKEVTLIGQNVNSYNGKNPGQPDFADLLAMVNRIEGLKQIRFTTSHPKDMSTKLLDCFGDLSKLAPHCHLPVQAGSNNTLKRMNRKYTREQYLELVEQLRIRVPGIAISTDLIVGFPGETDRDFADTIDLVQRVEYDYAFSFKYSPRIETRAAGFPDQVPEDTKRDRLIALQTLLDEQTRASNESCLGSTMKVLVEGPSRKDPERLTGHSPCGRVVNFCGSPSWVGRFVEIKITEALAHSLAGEPEGLTAER